MLFMLFRKLIFLLLGVGLIILGIALKNFIIVLVGICLFLLYLFTKKWKRRKKKNKKRR